jgi:hypothetical protein
MSEEKASETTAVKNGQPGSESTMSGGMASIHARDEHLRRPPRRG